jgi:hypothetical protein
MSLSPFETLYQYIFENLLIRAGLVPIDPSLVQAIQMPITDVPIE